MHMRILAIAIGVLFLVPASLLSQPPAKAKSAVLFTNAKVFDGKAEKLSAPTSVLVVGNTIAKVGVDLKAPDGAAVIDAGGRTLMPGLIDAHTHIGMSSLSMPALMTADSSYIHLMAVKEAERTLLRGFTTIRDMGGPAFGLKRAIDEGHFAGPRIYPSGAMISQSAGHGDFRLPYDVLKRPGLTRAEELGAGFVADGQAAVLKAVREQLLQGASQVKLAAGGGVSSSFDPLDVTQYTEDELKAAVKAADDWGTYVTVHAYTPKAVKRAVDAGVKCLEHGQLIDEETARLLAAKGVWMCTQPFLDDEDAIPQPNPANRKKQIAMSAGTDVSIRLAIKHKVKLGWGTDALFDAVHAAKQGKQLVKMAKWFEPHEVLRLATATNGALVALSGERNPYPGKLGVIEEGALADILLVDGDPIADIKLLADPEKKFVVIMKDGTIYKNTIK